MNDNPTRTTFCMTFPPLVFVLCRAGVAARERDAKSSFLRKRTSDEKAFYCKYSFSLKCTDVARRIIRLITIVHPFLPLSNMANALANAMCERCKSGFAPLEKIVNSNGELYHEQCFVCAQCFQQFPEGLFYEVKPSPLVLLFAVVNQRLMLRPC